MAHTAMFDTLHYANKLKAAGVSDEHAEVQAETLAEVLEESHKDLVTKVEFEQLRSDINVKFAEVYRAIAENKNEIVKWFVGISAGQIALIFTMLKFVH